MLMEIDINNICVGKELSLVVSRSLIIQKKSGKLVLLNELGTQLCRAVDANAEQRSFREGRGSAVQLATTTKRPSIKLWG